jgi:nucleoside-diphosphate-sugar epimerase
MKTKFTDRQKQTKIFVLGATGFIGSALIKRLVTSGFTNVWAMYRSENKRAELFQGNHGSKITFLQGSASEIDLLKRGIKGAGIVVNAMGMPTDWGILRDFQLINVEIPQAVVRLLAGQKKTAQFIHISSASIFGFSSGEKTEASPLVKSDRFYTSSKVDFHHWLRQARNRPNPKITILSPSIVWGAGDQTFLPTFRDRLRKGQMLYWGRHKPLDFVHIDDLVDAILLCLFNERTYRQEYIINGPESFPLRNYVGKIAEYSKLAPPRLSLPFSMALLISRVMEGWARLINPFKPHYRPLLTQFQVYLLAEPLKLVIAHACEELGYRPRIDFSAGLHGLKDYIRKSKFAGLDGKYK